MTQLDKLIAKARARPSEMRYEDVYTLLTSLGWTLKHDRGTHVSFVKPGELPLGIVKKGGKTVSRTYITILCERLGLND